jgi:D-alanyl-D-alanine carboxypeptidase
VARWLPGLLVDGDIITVRQLLNHTSGLFDYTNDPALLAGVIRNRVFQPQELVAMAQAHPRMFPPGTHWAYSNTNYIVAGLLVQAVTGHRLGQELQRRIFGPLDLTGTSFPDTTGQIRGYHAHGYVPTDLLPTADGRPLDVTDLNPSNAWAAGAIVSTTGDLSRFLRSLMDGGLLSPRLLRLMTTTVADPEDPDSAHGLGIDRFHSSCGTIWGHGGAIVGYQDVAYWNQNTQRVVVLATTMWPTPATALTPLNNVIDFALCGASGPTSATGTGRT